MAQASDPQRELIEALAEYTHRPLDFAYFAFPWGVPGTELEFRNNLEPWQARVLGSIQDKLLNGRLTPSGAVACAIQEAVKSGHDIGKSALVCIVMWWAISTAEDTKGVVTANTERQLQRKLWAELNKWHRLFIGRELFRVTASAIHSADPEHEREWRIDAIAWSEDNPEAFAGLHNYGKRVIVIFDEASGIPDIIWEVIDGVFNEEDTELIWLVTGNPTRNTGRFRECFDARGQGRFWTPTTVDSREVSFTNKSRINEQIDLWGIDSDFIRVRWLGEFPSAGSTQLIPSELVTLAIGRQAQSQPWEPLILALDVARFGTNKSVARFRRGKDARTIPPVKWRGLSTIELGTALAGLICQHSPDMVFIDEGGIGGGVIDFVRHLGYSVTGVLFGGIAGVALSGEKAANKRAEMYLSLRHWLREGGAIDDDRELETDLTAVEYGHAKKSEAILLTPKDDMEESPDDGDALAMTFAFPVAKKSAMVKPKIAVEYDPFAWNEVNTPNGHYHEYGPH